MARVEGIRSISKFAVLKPAPSSKNPKPQFTAAGSLGQKFRAQLENISSVAVMTSYTGLDNDNNKNMLIKN